MTLREWMDLQGLNNAEMASRLGVATNTVSRWRNGVRRPRAGELAGISTVTAGAVTANDFYHSSRSVPEHA